MTALLLFLVAYCADLFLRFKGGVSSSLSWVSSIYSILSIEGEVLALFLTGHIITILIRTLRSQKRRSFIWIVYQEAIPLVIPLMVFGMINCLHGSLNLHFSELLVGIIGGVISSIIVLVLNRKNNLPDCILRALAPEFLEDNDSRQNPASAEIKTTTQVLKKQNKKRQNKKKRICK